MGVVRNVLRAEAKKVYKEQVKSVPKNKRMPFSQFFKQYKKLRGGQIEQPGEAEEDFDFEELVNINEVSDDDLEVGNTEEEDDS